MTVAELIDKLKTYPAEMEVLIVEEYIADEYALKPPVIFEEWIDMLPEQDRYTREPIGYKDPRPDLRYAPAGTGRLALVLRPR